MSRQRWLETLSTPTQHVSFVAPSRLTLAIAALGLAALAADQYVLFWCTCIAAFATGLRTSPPVDLKGTAVEPASNDVSNRGAVFLVLAAVAAVGSAVSRRVDQDDSIYLGFARGTLDHPEVALHSVDLTLGVPGLPVLIPAYKVHSFELLSALMSSYTGIDLTTVYYIITPTIAALIAVAVWAVVLREFLGRRWILGLIALLFCSLILGEVHRSFGNFAFNRIFQGKTVFAFVASPLLYAYTYRYISGRQVQHLWLLAATTVASIGLTSSALFATPAIVGLAATAALFCTWDRSSVRIREFVLSMASLTYVLGVGLVFKFMSHNMDLDAGRTLNMLEEFHKVLGARQQYLVLAALILAWAFIRTPVVRKFLLASSALFFLSFLNPLAFQTIADQITSVHTFWRVFWIAPTGIALAVLLTGMSTWLGGQRRSFLALAGILMVLTLAWRPLNTLRYGVGAPAVKIDAGEFEAARRVSQAAPSWGLVLAPEEVSTWIPIVADHPSLLYSRFFYTYFFAQTPGTFSPQEVAQRRQIYNAMRKPRLADKDLSTLRAGLHRFGISSLTLRQTQVSPAVDRFFASWSSGRSKFGAYVNWVRAEP